MRNEISLDTLCAALAYAMGIEAPALAAAADPRLCDYVDKAFGGKKADRVVMYNPDAIAQWIYEKYPYFLRRAVENTELELPYCSVMPSVTPVCFGTMYTGTQPAVHGIQKYEKPVIRIDTLFDALIRAGKRPVIVGHGNCSLSNIFLEREMDYFAYDTEEQANAKAAEILLEDKYDFVVIYNGNYDGKMHKFGPESYEAIGELRANAHDFAIFSEMIKTRWTEHNTLVGFAMDHGCHHIDEGCGSHGLDMDEDMNIVHRYMAYPSEK